VCVCCLGVVHAPVQFAHRTLPHSCMHWSSQCWSHLMLNDPFRGVPSNTSSLYKFSRCSAIQCGGNHRGASLCSMLRGGLISAPPIPTGFWSFLWNPVDSGVFSFQWNWIIPEFILEWSPEWCCSPEWAGTEFHWNLFIYLLFIIVYLFLMSNKQCLFGNDGHQIQPLSFSHHHLFFPPPPTMLVTAANHAHHFHHPL